MKTCEICGNLFEPKPTGQSRKYCFDCSPSYVKGGSRANTITALRRAMKREAVKRMGGACQRCGYNRCIDALTFHHTDPNEKEFGVGNGNTREWTNYWQEVQKCELLCANCHAEMHADKEDFL